MSHFHCRRKNCNLCVEKDKDECFWCENTGECFPFAHYISHHMSGQCQEWVDSDDLLHNHTCRDCSIYKSCDNCLSRYGCGWCGNVDNRMIGKCVDGDFSGTYIDQFDPLTFILYLKSDRSNYYCNVMNSLNLGAEGCY